MSAVWNDLDDACNLMPAIKSKDENRTSGSKNIESSTFREVLPKNNNECSSNYRNEKGTAKLQNHNIHKTLLEKASISKSVIAQTKVRKVKECIKDTNYHTSKYQKHSSERKQIIKTGAIPKNIHFTEKSSNKRCVKPMSFLQLRHLIETPANEVLFTILDKESGFCLLLEQNIKRDWMAHILLAISKAVTSNHTNNVMKMILLITSQSNFFLINVQQYLASFYQTKKSEQYHMDSLVSLSVFLYKYQVSFPSNASDILLILLPLLKQTSEKCLLCCKDRYSEVSNRLQELEDQNKLFIQKHSIGEIKQISRAEKLQQMSPPENFRSIPILPSLEDIHQSCPFLRPNKVKGTYEDTEHYLDVQYRLLREDYVKPLRDGITEYLTLKQRGKSINHCKDVKVYQDVIIVKQDFVNGGLIHMAQFSDKKFKKIKWEYSKRFLSGSLLCLSSDDFKTMMFAFVAKREPKELSKGLLFLKFEKLTDEVLNISPTRSFTVIETTAYFEAYRYNLDALLQLKEETLPMKHYIIETQKDVQMPQYLNATTKYDFRPLFLPLGKIKTTEEKRAPSKTRLGVKVVKKEVFSTPVYPSSIPERAQAVDIMDDKNWPSHCELNLDPTQHEALKAAVTKEFAVIQGPPGTGKTFVGLRIAQLLLHNIKKWQMDTKQLPILVICYTNHALDQFLEGLLLFTDKLIRIGGRGTNESISKFGLSNIKQEIKSRREVPHYIFSNIKQKYSEVHSIKDSIENINGFINRALNSILGENVLKPFMLPKHYSSLRNYGHYLKDDGKFTHDWLFIRYRDDLSQQIQSIPYRPIVTKKVQFNETPEKSFSTEYENEDSEGEADIEYIEAQRDIDSEEFAGASYDLPISEENNDLCLVSEEGWQIQGGVKYLKPYITSKLKNSPALLESEAMKIQNVWKLNNVTQRWQLYKYWVDRYIKEKKKEKMGLQEELRKEYEELCEMRIEEDINVCQQAHVVGMTTTGAAKYRHIVQHLNPRVLIVEEAAEILESHIVTSLAPGTQHIILIGDHQQLRPSPTVHLLAVKYDLNVSLFERMVENGLECHKLGIQHRMRPDIARLLVPHIYTDLKNHQSVGQYENIKGVCKNIFFITHSNNEMQEYDSKSKVNQHEAKFLLKLCKYLLLQGYNSSQITILTTYSGQLFEMKRLCGSGMLQDVKMTVVDNYQGEENDIVLISFVRSNEEGQIGFLKISNRVCVALSRAKKGLFCIGNFNLLAEKSDLWKNIVNQLEQDRAIGPSLQLTCQNHPGVSSIVSEAEDFDSVPEGGCAQKCEFRLSCGHVCSLMCHPYDVEHNEINCLKPCSKFCEDGHQCPKKCFEECGPCKYVLENILMKCQHTIDVFCYLKNENICTKLCKKYLPCGHMCGNSCQESCESKCKEKIKIKSKICGHFVIIECFDYENRDTLSKCCSEPCRVELACGHMCVGKCNECRQGRLHVSCNQPCKHILVCGHECKSPCSKSCPPCKQKCLNECIHSKCPKKCGEPCKKCTEPCEWSCSHKKCNCLCGEPCDRTACDEPCAKLLKCQHQCIGLCGEPCPTECRVCDEEKVKEIFFGTEDENDTRFVSLEDCGHIFEVNGITQWMNHDKLENREVQMKGCPKCKVVIRKSLRFGNIIKSCLSDIEKVKKITYGDTQKNIKLQKNLLHRLVGSGASFRWTCWPLLKTLESKKTRSIQEITIMENIINLIFDLMIATKYVDSNIHTKFTYPLNLRKEDTSMKNVNVDFEDLFQNLKLYMKNTRQWLNIFLRNNYSLASDQQLQELSWEVHRLKLANNLLKLFQKKISIKHKEHIEKLLTIIMTYAPFQEKDSIIFNKEFKSFVKLVDGAEINISNLEKQTILKAMGLSKGHWYQCPNGHVYCITECGGAVEKSNCNECKETIGGTMHRLLSSNRVATAMDGAEHSAWFDAMDMENYRF